MWIHMLIGVSETFFNFKYNVALFLKLYMLIKSLVVFFRVQLEKIWHYLYFFCDTYCLQFQFQLQISITEITLKRICKVITCKVCTMCLADLVHSEHDTFSCRPLKNTTREQISLYTFEKIRYIRVKIGGNSHTYQQRYPFPLFSSSKKGCFKDSGKRELSCQN